MGLLDSKTRIMDTVLTLEGRRQLADGQLRFSYVSFTDAGAYYEADVTSGSTDATARVYMEAKSLPTDQVTFQTDVDNRVREFSGPAAEKIRAGKIVSFYEPNSNVVMLTGSTRLLAGEEFLNTADSLLTSSIDNFRRLYMIGTRDALFEDDGFSVGPQSVTFTMIDDRPINDARHMSVNVNNLDSIFNDPRLSVLSNFAHLPPVNKITPGVPVTRLGNYPPWGRKLTLTASDTMRELDNVEKLGYSRRIMFDPTSRDNRVIAQLFELSDSTIRKLDVIDFGTHNLPNRPAVHIFFIGRTLLDDRNTQTFIHIFTLVFE